MSLSSHYLFDRFVVIHPPKKQSNKWINISICKYYNKGGQYAGRINTYNMVYDMMSESNKKNHNDEGRKDIIKILYSSCSSSSLTPRMYCSESKPTLFRMAIHVSLYLAAMVAKLTCPRDRSSSIEVDHATYEPSYWLADCKPSEGFPVP